MKWDDFLNEEVDYGFTGQRLTDIECPECGRHIYLNTTLTLTSFPAKYHYWCSCGWTDYAPIKWDGKKQK